MPPVVAVPLQFCWRATPGGTGVAALAMTRALAEAGRVRPIGLVPRVGTPAPGFEPHVETAPMPPTPWPPLPPALIARGWRWLGRPRPEVAARRVDHAVDLVHLMAPLAPRSGSVPMVATVHDLFPLTMPGAFSPHGAAVMGDALRTVARRAAMVMCSSEATARDAAEWGFDPNRIRVVPLAATVTTPDDRVRAEVRRRFELDRPYVVTVGTLEPRKNLDAVLGAAPELERRGVDLVAIGPTGWAGVDERLRRSGAIRMLGRLDRRDLDAVVAGALVAAQPSLAEGFGLPVLEAMALGTAVVTSSGTATEEVAGGAARLVDPGDVDDVTAGILELVDDDGARDELSVRGSRRAREFTWERTARQVADVYDEVLGR